MNANILTKIRFFLREAENAIRSNDFILALDSLSTVLRMNAFHETALLYSAQCQHALGNYSESEKLFTALTGKFPSVGFYHHSLALMYKDWQKLPESLSASREAARLMPNTAEVWAQLSFTYRCLNDGINALDSANRAVKIKPSSHSLKHRGYANLMLHRTSEASADFTASMRLAFSTESDILRTEFVDTTPAKLSHDIEQYKYLHRISGDSKYLNFADAHQRFLRTLPSEMPSDEIISMTPTTLQALEYSYNRLHHFETALRIDGSAINTQCDFSQIEVDYKNRLPGITWIDNFLRPETLSTLRKYCLENTFWFDCHHPNGYLGALMENGFAAPLLFQIAEDLHNHLPEIFKDYPLFQMWAFKYDSKLSGIQMHADVAAVNLNFWITEDEANLDQTNGGLVVWDKEAPIDWRFKEFNSGGVQQQARISEFLSSSGAERIAIPYKCNRAVLFNSDLFHCTDDIHFKEGYENRRINITLLFGQR